jgi:hypothetical protein
VLEYPNCQISIATYIILVHMQYMQMFDPSFKLVAIAEISFQ